LEKNQQQLLEEKNKHINLLEKTKILEEEINNNYELLKKNQQQLLEEKNQQQ
jgi:hypothetical protein